MQKLYFSPTRDTPEINFSPEENIYLIRGNSSPEDVRAIYYPVIDWFRNLSVEVLENKTLLFTKEKPLKFEIDLSYFNSSSAKFLFDILTELKSFRNAGLPVFVEWHYDEGDVDMLEAGHDISSIAELEFNYIEKKDS